MLLHISFIAAGQNIANPLATILSTAIMLDHLGLIDEAIEVRQAVNASLRHGMVTEDLAEGNGVVTDRCGDFIANYIAEGEAEAKGSFFNIKMGLSTII